MGQNKKYIIISLFFAFLTFLITYPAILHLGDKIIGDGGDSLQFLGFQNLAKRLFYEGQFPFGWTSHWRYPYGINFQNIYDSALLVIMGLGLYQFITDPVIVYNVSVFLFILLNLSLSYVSFRSLFSPFITTVGAVIYGLSFYAIARLGGHINLFLTSCFPFFFFALYRLYTSKGTKKSFAIFGISLLLVAFSSLQYPLIMIGSLFIMAPIALIFLRKEVKEFIHIFWQKKKLVFCTLSCVLLIFSLFYGQKLLGFVNHDVQMPVNEITSVPPINFIIPNSYLQTVSSFITNPTEKWIEYVVFFGYVELVLLAFAIVFLKNTKLKILLLTVAGIFFILALGKQPFLQPIWPYQYLFPHFPYRAIIEPGRFSLITYMCITALILMLLAQIKNKFILCAIFALLIFERLPIQFPLSQNVVSTPFIDAVNTSSTKAVVNLPTYSDWWNGQVYDFYASYWNKSMVNGYVQWSGNTPSSQTLTKELEDYSCQYNPLPEPPVLDPVQANDKKGFLISTMHKYDIRTLIVHKDLYLSDPRCEKAAFYIQTLLNPADQWNTLYEDDQKIVYWLK